MSRPNNPHNPQEWQEAVDAAAACVALQDATWYGLIACPFTINVKRCEEILARGKLLGITPSKSPCELGADYVTEWNRRHGLDQIRADTEGAAKWR